MGQHSGRDYAAPGAGGQQGPGGQQDPQGPGYTYGGDLAKQDRGLSQEQIEAGMRQTYGQDGNQPPSGGHSGGGYEISLGQLRYAINQVQDMLQAARDDRYDAQRIADAVSPAQDAESSVMFTDALKQRGRQILGVIDENVRDIQAYLDHLVDIERNYAHQRDDTKVSFQDLQRSL